jgi:hypothetical protein
MYLITVFSSSLLSQQEKLINLGLKMHEFPFLQKCEFSLTDRAKDFPGQIVARLSIPKQTY